jgi:poly(3-hydroxybutyrate) depolymerase
MKKLKLCLLVLFALTTSFAFIYNINVIRPGIQKMNAVISPDRNRDFQGPSIFVLQTEHPAYRSDGSIVTLSEPSTLLFGIRKPGHSVLVLKSRTPLMITEQKGLTAWLHPGWDGTLGYSLYALDVEAASTGTGMVCLMSTPVPEGLALSQSEVDARISRFPDNPEAFLKWQIEWRKKLAGRLMNGGIPLRVPLSAEVLVTEDHPSFTLHRVRYQSQPDRSNTLLLSLPKNIPGQVPLLIALHGHEATWGEADAGAFTTGHSDDFCAYFAERGWAVVQPATMNHTLQHSGWTLQGEWTWDAMVALDYAISVTEIDSKRVSVCGLSTGGHLAMNLLALDDRVRSGVVGCVLSTWHHYRERMRIPPHCDCGILGQLGDLIEQCDWAALAAPKPVLFQHGRQDASYCPGANPALLDTEWNTSVMPEQEFAAIFNEVKKAYQLTGKPEQVKLHIHEDGHRVNNETAYGFLMPESL